MERATPEQPDFLARAKELLAEGFVHLPSVASTGLAKYEQDALLEAAERLQDNYPYHHPLYVGQMLKPPHPLARNAYALAMCLNPNNHALDGGRASSRMEREAVAGLANMFGWDEHLGHLCGGGTMANFEALWVAREESRSRHGVAGAVAASAQAHYTHERLSSVLDRPFVKIDVDAAGRMSIPSLERALEAASQTIDTVVVTLGTTAAGAIDPLPAVLALRERYGFRIHVDAAYGGYFTLADGISAYARAAFDAIRAVDSVVIDPHKHGLQPYGCGCVLFRDPTVGRHYRHDSPYTYFSSDELHLGEISLECSRAGAAAVALWTTMRAMPLEREGDFACGLEACLSAARRLYKHCQQHPRLAPIFAPELDLLVVAVKSPTAAESSTLAQEIFDEAAACDLHLAVVRVPRALALRAEAVTDWQDEETILCLRFCTMKPEHLPWLEQIRKRLDGAVTTVFERAAQTESLQAQVR
ncbi:MAG: pyridoxal-dependent decarboxylase [Pseudomonadota bacterium]